ncbi:hypothetical protein [Sorangium sp. So ce406]|uniref:hypothetical protein n=1 Tax=Sorangium sp. So ce406 TaxID=3133311 RepID=UPI003F5BEA00
MTSIQRIAIPAGLTIIRLTSTSRSKAVQAAGFLALEWCRSMDGLSWPVNVLASLFQSAMTRTEGFNEERVGIG